MGSNDRVIDSEEDLKKREQVQQDLRNQNLEDLRAILSTPAGMRFFKRFFDEGKMFTTCMTGNSWTYHNEGKRDFVAMFFSDIAESCPEKIPALILRGK